jgi:hypothetical protein
MLSRPAAVSLASRRLRKWGREGGTRRGRSERPCSAYARSSSIRRRTLRCASAASRRTGSGTSAVDPRNPRERRTRWLRIGGSIEIRSRTPAWIAARAAPVRGRRSGVLAQPRARRKDHDRLAPAREASRCRDCAARFVAPARRERAERSHEPPEQRSLEELDLRHAAERARIEREREREAVESRQVVRAEDEAPGGEVLAAAHPRPEGEPGQRLADRG